ncbi:MAG: hypothetical protein Q9163_002221 [Psora crenata]
MSQGRSPSGVASLRARFEQNQKDNQKSPPSRGRSPAATTAGDATRPLCKVRTSFVAVEPSEHMASTIQAPLVDGAGGSKVAAAAQDKSNEAGNASASDPDEPKMNGQTTEARTYSSDANPDNPASTTDAGAENAASAGSALAETAQGLGPILKGSPFEGEENIEVSGPGTAAPESQPVIRPSQTSQAPPATPPTEVQASEPIFKPAQAPMHSPKKDDSPGTGPLINGKRKEAQPHKNGSPAKSKAATTSAIQKRATPPVTKPTSKESSTKALAAPRASTTTAAPAGKAAAKGASKKPTTANQALKTTSEATKKGTQNESDKLGIATKASTTAAKTTGPITSPTTSSSVAQLKKKTGPSSPQNSTKTRSKSPTRPIRLAPAATAQTAAFAAKHESESQKPPSRSPSRTSHTSTANKTRTASLSKPTRPGGIRASLPAGSKPTERSKPKQRTSMASSKAPEGSFLERMMRPTQSSAQKTHEKIEIKSPPKKAATKPKRKSEESIDSNSNGGAKEPTEEGSSGAKEPNEGEERSVAQEEPAGKGSEPEPLPSSETSAQKSDDMVEDLPTTAPEATSDEQTAP